MLKFLGILFAMSGIIVGAHNVTAKEDEPVETPQKALTERYVVTGDYGGSVTDFQQALQYMSDNKMKIKLEGDCASACTLLLSSKYKLDVCVTPEAKFMFHQPFMVSFTGFGYKLDSSIPSIVASEQMWKNDFYGTFPIWLRSKIDANGGVPSVYRGAKPMETFDLTADQVKEFVPLCD